ncbi:non-ribosomal peptide synthetase [Lonsdalea britannica]|uniref:non-ribosomal peptide synthetase n=1 Tax=Lonsdalea britannica TaxID=1082704 RepID=UPI000A1E6B56|nr:non-ribosomal peptide synthetase [Lonsdalea britannica]OSN09427.1 non-ribosomal peptide synthetase [Lonsdalea britannica]
MPEKEPCPLSAAQQEVCFAIAKAEHNFNYHLCDVLEFKGQLNSALLVQTINTVCREVDTTHTQYEIDPASGQYVQYIVPCLTHEYVQCVDLTAESDPEPAYQALLDNLLDHDMDLSHAPLIRYCLVKIADDQHRLIEMGTHLILDGYSHGILFRLLAEHYGQLLRHETPAPLVLEPLKRVYEVEQVYRGSTSYLKDQAYWRAYCLDLPEVTQLVPGSVPLSKLNRLRNRYTGENLDRLRTVAAVEYPELRLSSILIAVCAAYLHKMTGEDELVVGMPVAARKMKALRNVLSMVANILPLHISFDADSTIVSVAAAVQRQLRHHLLHQGYRSESMIRDLYAERGHKPLFNTLINVIAYDQSAHFDGCEMSVDNVACGPVEHLSFNIFDRNSDGHLDFGFDANADLYSMEALELYYQRLVSLLEQFVDAPETRVADFDLLLPGERERVYPLPPRPDALPLFPETFAESARSHANEIALVQDKRQVSYAELDEASHRLAAYLQERGIRSGDDVAVIVARSVEWVVTMAALFKLGACYIPIVPELPEGRISYILSDAKPAAVIVVSDSPLNADVDPSIVLRLTTEKLASLPPATRPLDRFDPATLAYLIYTSGSTGKPKGVEVTHRNLVSIAGSAIAAAKLQPGVRVLQFIAAGFDMSVLEIFMTLLSGATLVIADKVSATPGRALASLIKSKNIHALVMTPSLLAYHQTEDFPQGMTLLLGGEACTLALLARFSHCRLLNVYGPTETSFATSINAHYGSGDLSIGEPTANTRLYVVDRNQHLLPPGAWGELYIAGPGVARGYRNRPDLTAEGFVPDLQDAERRMYRAGDRVFFDHQGLIHYQGRKDNQVKLRGLRIELDEIKNALLSCQGVEDAVAMLKELAYGPAIVAYVANSQLELDSETLKLAVGRQLPQYMVPSVIMVVESFPLTPNGKLAVRELPEPIMQDNVELSPPRTSEEASLCRLFAQILECDKVYANQNFFTLGGHSLLGLQLINLIRDEFGVQLGITDFLSSPTPRQLAQRLRIAGCAADPFDPILPLRTMGDRPPLFCFHPGGGIGWAFAGLLPYLPDDQPVYALQSPILQDPTRVIHSIDEMAVEYLRRIRTIWPHGPYQLAGWSVGGNVALRVANLLQAAGEEVSFLTMFDSYPLQNGRDSLKLDDETIITRMTRAICGAARGGMKGLKSAMEEALGDRSIRETFLTRLIGDASLMLDLLEKCRYQPFHGDLLFIRASTDVLRSQEQQPDLWCPYVTGKLIQYDVDATHECLMQRQYLQQFGRQFADELLKRQNCTA